MGGEGDMERIDTMSDTQTTITAERVRELLRTRMESTYPIEVLDWLKGWVGKQLGKRLEDAANKRWPGQRWRVGEEDGMVHMRNEAYWATRWAREDSEVYKQAQGRAVDLLLNHTGGRGNGVLEERYLTEHNTRYTEGAVKRNSAREYLLNTPDGEEKCKRLAEMTVVLKRAQRAYEQACTPFDFDNAVVKELMGRDGQ